MKRPAAALGEGPDRICEWGSLIPARLESWVNPRLAAVADNIPVCCCNGGNGRMTSFFAGGGNGLSSEMV